MKETEVLSRIFATNPSYEVNRFGRLAFYFSSTTINVNQCYFLELYTNDGLEKLIRFCEIKEIKITDSKIIFILQGCGYRWEDGDKIEVMK